MTELLMNGGIAAGEKIKFTTTSTNNNNNNNNNGSSKSNGSLTSIYHESIDHPSDLYKVKDLNLKDTSRALKVSTALVSQFTSIVTAARFSFFHIFFFFRAKSVKMQLCALAQNVL